MFPDSLKSYTSQKTERCNIIKEIRKQLEACQQKEKFEVKFEISKWKTPRVLSFSLQSRALNERVDFDVLPAFNALGEPHPHPPDFSFSRRKMGSGVMGPGGWRESHVT